MRSLLLILYCFIVAGFPQCTKPKIHYLRPVVTVTPDSRELFLCRINGMSYSPEALDSASLGGCTYSEVYSGESRWVFQIYADRHETGCRFFTVGIMLDSIVLKERTRYVLGTPGKKKNYGWYFRTTECGQPREEIYTSDDLYGEIFIDRFDPVRKIVTGTFDFNSKDKNGNIYRVSDGVFDRHFK